MAGPSPHNRVMRPLIPPRVLQIAFEVHVAPQVEAAAAAAAGVLQPFLAQCTTQHETIAWVTMSSSLG